MNTNDTAKLDSILDKANEVKEILQQEYVAGKIDIKTVGHIKASVSNILKRIPQERFEVLRRELYDLLSIAKM